METTMTGTELIMEIADRFAKFGEAKDMLVVYTDVNGRVRLKSNCDYTRSLGLAQWARDDISDSLVHAEGGDFDEQERAEP
jgi:hypothetical protein